MKGFSSRWENFPDYILGMTKEIWEDRGLATLTHYYTPDLIVRSPVGMVVGNKAVIAATMSALVEFPDRTLLGEDVIWSGSPETGMLSSHRILSTATHMGNGAYGKATGKKLTYRVIADCHAIDEQINDEWLVQDRGAIARQLGWDDAKEFTIDQITREGGPENCKQPFTPKIDTLGPYTGTGNDDEWGEKYAGILNRIMLADTTVIATEFDRACQLEYPGGVTGHSFGDAERFWMGLRASFPSAKFKIEHQIGSEDPLMPPRAAIRWSLQGKHDGWGAFGRPTDVDVYVMGISHAEFGPRGLRREYVVYDEIAIWKQILLGAG